jgi:ribose-phosphate pyrophosphokinase
MTTTQHTLAVFSLNPACAVGPKICAHLGITATPLEERTFEDGEHKTRSMVSVRGKDVFVVQSLHGDSRQSVNDKLCRLLFFVGSLRDASAASITVISPYLCYSRKDKRSKPRDPVVTRYVATLLEAMGTDRIVTLDVHNLAAFQNAFRIPTEHLEAKHLFEDHFRPLVCDENVTVISPDAGGVRRAEAFRQALARVTNRQPLCGFLEKHRAEDTLTGAALIGDVRGRTAIIIDDLISSGSTLARAAEICRAHGATKVFAAATHAVFSSRTSTILHAAAFDGVVVTDTIPVAADCVARLGSKLVVLDSTKLLAETIRRLHVGESVSQLTEA